MNRVSKFLIRLSSGNQGNVKWGGAHPGGNPTPELART